MRQQIIYPKNLAWVVLFLCSIDTLANTHRSTLDNKTPQKQEAVFYGNPLLLNNKSLSYGAFSISSKGVLVVVKGNPKTAAPESIPFRIYLLRNGHAVQEGASDVRQSVQSIEVESVLAVAKFGDEIVIEPTRKSDAPAKRIIRLNPFFNSDLLSVFRKGKNGC